MKMIECVNAYTATLTLAQREMEPKTAYALVRLKRKLQPHVDFFLSEERRLAEEYAKKDGKGRMELTEHGTFLFEDPERAEEYNERRKELGDMEVDEEFSPRRVRAPESITPMQLEALEGFVEFEE